MPATTDHSVNEVSDELKLMQAHLAKLIATVTTELMCLSDRLDVLTTMAESAAWEISVAEPTDFPQTLDGTQLPF